MKVDIQLVVEVENEKKLRAHDAEMDNHVDHGEEISLAKIVHDNVIAFDRPGGLEAIGLEVVYSDFQVHNNQDRNVPGDIESEISFYRSGHPMRRLQMIFVVQIIMDAVLDRLVNLSPLHLTSRDRQDLVCDDEGLWDIAPEEKMAIELAADTLSVLTAQYQADGFEINDVYRCTRFFDRCKAMILRNWKDPKRVRKLLQDGKQHALREILQAYPNVATHAQQFVDVAFYEGNASVPAIDVYDRDEEDEDEEEREPMRVLTPGGHLETALKDCKNTMFWGVSVLRANSEIFYVPAPQHGCIWLVDNQGRLLETPSDNTHDRYPRVEQEITDDTAFFLRPLAGSVIDGAVHFNLEDEDSDADVEILSIGEPPQGKLWYITIDGEVKAVPLPKKRLGTDDGMSLKDQASLKTAIAYARNVREEHVTRRISCTVLLSDRLIIAEEATIGNARLPEPKDGCAWVYNKARREFVEMKVPR